MRTKWEILQAQREELRQQLDKANHRLDSLINTPCHLHCDKCGTVLETEADFAKHFVIPDERYLNLGWCPQDDPEDIHRRSRGLR